MKIFREVRSRHLVVTARSKRQLDR